MRNGIARCHAGTPIMQAFERERLLPAVPAVIRSVDLEAGVVQVEWEAHW